eukprot:CAMPEP_0117421002 /NCGR_PEP_ID=MMETSP0758-20121206/2210_1 /TAXON_ID=63605 /ORGANISM="Percolomonas cosmopolitus, Strain AE-1 (ATCC 50343)" /LENGTH=1136 /DNA_ID=CAMNT_0005202923 /DNA_START=737 /DNA_END=4144 /DNA_ORIENTATION=+
MTYDLERIIDDFVLICFFCGNDFIPHGPSLDIGQNAIATLFDIYKDILVKVGGYLTHKGKINFSRLQPFIGRIAKMEPEVMDSIMKDRVQQMNKRRRGKKKIKLGIRKKRNTKEAPKLEKTDFFDVLDDNLEGEALEKQLAALSRESENDVVDPLTALDLTAQGNKADPIMLTSDDVKQLPADEEEDEEEDEEANFLNDIATPSPTPTKPSYGDLLIDAHNDDGNLDFELWQKNYYKTKLGIDMDDEEAMMTLKKRYVEGIIWVYEYYYNGCPSWKWFYPYAYSPLLSSLNDVRSIVKSLEPFEMGKPFTPFQQLLGVLPPKSADFLPEPYRALMCEFDSPVIDLYPTTIEIDREGTKYDYEGVVILPFMDEDRLLAAEAPLRSKLTKIEKKRNAFGESKLFTFDKTLSYTQEPSLPDLNPIEDCHVRVEDYIHPTYEGKYDPVLVEGVSLGKHTLEGYPTFDATKIYNICHSNAGIRIFGHPSKKESMIIEIYDENALVEDPMEELEKYKEFIGKEVYIGYPYPRRAIVNSLSCRTATFDGKNTNNHSNEEQRDFKREALKHQEVLKTRQGIDVGEVHVLVYCSPLQEMIVNTYGQVIPRFSSVDEEYGYPAQVLCLDYDPVKDPKFRKRNLESDDDRIVCLDSKYFGLPGEIVQSAGKKKVTATIQVNKTPAPSLKRISKLGNTSYLPLWQIAKKLRAPNKEPISSKQLGRLVGKFQLGDKSSSHFVGLRIRNTKASKCLLGMAKVDISSQSKDETYLLNRSTMITKGSNFSTVSTSSNWVFSTKLIGILQKYLSKFPEVFEAANLEQKRIFPVDVFPEETVEKMQEVADFIDSLGLKELPNMHVSRLQFPNDVIAEMEDELEAYCEAIPQDEIEEETTTLYSNQYIVPSLTTSTSDMKYCEDIELGTRVVYARSFGGIPLGARGTVVGIQGTLAHVVFDRCFTGASKLRGQLKTLRGQSVEMEYLINISMPHVYDLPHQKPTKFRKGFDTNHAYGSHYYSVQSFRQKNNLQKQDYQHHKKQHSKSMREPVVRQFEDYSKKPDNHWNNKPQNEEEEKKQRNPKKHRGKSPKNTEQSKKDHKNKKKRQKSPKQDNQKEHKNDNNEQKKKHHKSSKKNSKKEHKNDNNEQKKNNGQ